MITPSKARKLRSQHKKDLLKTALIHCNDKIKSAALFNENNCSIGFSKSYDVIFYTIIHILKKNGYNVLIDNESSLYLKISW